MIENNHPAIVPADLFGEAYALRNQRGGKPRGRAAYYEPLDIGTACSGVSIMRRFATSRVTAQMAPGCATAITVMASALFA